MNVNYVDEDPDTLKFVSILDEAELNNGERVVIEFDNFNMVVFNIADKIFAIGDICTHDDGPIAEGELNVYEVACPRHGAKFDVRSGKALSVPAFVDIPAYPIRIVAGKIEVGIPQ